MTDQLITVSLYSSALAYPAGNPVPKQGEGPGVGEPYPLPVFSSPNVKTDIGKMLKIKSHVPV